MMKKKLNSLRYYKSANQKDKSSLWKLLTIWIFSCIDIIAVSIMVYRNPKKMLRPQMKWYMLDICMCVSQKIDTLHRYVVFAQTSALAECAAPWIRVLHTKSIINSLRFEASISNAHTWRANKGKDQIFTCPPRVYVKKLIFF